MSANPNISLDFVKSNREKNWNWNSISANPAITFKEIEENPNLPWNWYYIAQNPNLTIDFVIKNPILKNYIESISINKFKRNETLIWIHVKRMQTLYFKRKNEKIKRMLNILMPKVLSSIILEF